MLPANLANGLCDLPAFRARAPTKQAAAPQAPIVYARLVFLQNDKVGGIYSEGCSKLHTTRKNHPEGLKTQRYPPPQS